LLLAGGLFNVPRTKKLLTARFEVQILGEEPERVKDCPTMGSSFKYSYTGERLLPQLLIKP
jgi:hypothetical protein